MREYAQHKAVVASAAPYLRGWKNDLVFSASLFLFSSCAVMFRQSSCRLRAGMNLEAGWVSAGAVMWRTQFLPKDGSAPFWGLNFLKS